MQFAVACAPTSPGARRRHGHIQVRLIPELRAERLLLVHVNVIEALGRHVALVFDERIVGTAQVGEPSAAGRLHAFGLGVSDLRAGQSQYAAVPGYVSLLTNTVPVPSPLPV